MREVGTGYPQKFEPETLVGGAKPCLTVAICRLAGPRGGAQDIDRRHFRQVAVFQSHQAGVHEGVLAGQAGVTDHVGVHHPRAKRRAV